MLLGIDLGTSSVKCLLTSIDGSTQHMAEREYPIDRPQPGYAEQTPDRWWQNILEAAHELSQVAELSQVTGIGLSGQMHGTVLVNAEMAPIIPAIIWADQRTTEQCAALHQQIGDAMLAQTVGSGAFPGFMLPTLVWLKQHKPDIWSQARYALFPKDYVRLKLTGEPAQEPTDASSGLILDINTRRYAALLCETLGIDPAIFPTLVQPSEVAGHVTPAAAAELGIPAGTPVVAGAADQVTGSLGAGLIHANMLSITIGTGGTIVAPITQPLVDPAFNLHTFCDAEPNHWYLLGALLAGGMSLRWLRDSVFNLDKRDAFEKMTQMAASVPAGAGKLLYLPYLEGERRANQDSHTRGVFFGLQPQHEQGHFVRAVMEGVAFAVRRVLSDMRSLGVQPTTVIASGGGLRSPVWQQIMADVIGLPLTPIQVAEQSALGATILAGVGTGAYKNFEQAVDILVTYEEPIVPQAAAREVYNSHYEIFCSIYEHLQPDFLALSNLT